MLKSRSLFVLSALAFTFAASNAFALHASATKKHAHLYGYTLATDQAENDPDIHELFTAAAKDKAKKLLVVGGLHGYAKTGNPTGQDKKEKAVCSFSAGDQANKGAFKGINFTYMNIAKYTTDGSDVSAEKQKEIAAKVKEYLDGGYYVLLSWCFSHVWAEKEGL
jgi:hypothetical protein